MIASTTQFVVTPLGAAIVEAMPDRKREKEITRDFKRKRICPVSKLFPTPSLVTAFYAERGKKVEGVLPQSV